MPGLQIDMANEQPSFLFSDALAKRWKRETEQMEERHEKCWRSMLAHQLSGRPLKIVES